MSKALKYLVTLILTFAGILNSIACNCFEQSTISEGIKYADVVFSGKVIAKDWTTNFDSLGVEITGDTSNKYFSLLEIPTAVVKIKVDTLYKGHSVSNTITILTPMMGASCGSSFQIGQKYVVYATIFDHLITQYRLRRRTFDGKTFWTHQCTRTQIWSLAEERNIMLEAKK